jgi:broad specificity phosphatase PhoE
LAWQAVRVAVGIAFAQAAVSADDEAGRIAGWRSHPLSPYGRAQARELGQRWRGNGLAAVFCSDLPRVTETVEIAFAGFRIPIHRDTRLRDCDYGTLTGQPVAELVEHDRLRCADPFPDGQSYRQVVEQTRNFLTDLVAAWDGRRVMIVAHRINRLALAHLLAGQPFEELIHQHPAAPRPGPAGPGGAAAELDGATGIPGSGWSYVLPSDWPHRHPPPDSGG